MYGAFLVPLFFFFFLLFLSFLAFCLFLMSRSAGSSLIASSLQVDHTGVPLDEPRFLDCFEQFFAKAAARTDIPVGILEKMKVSRQRAKSGAEWLLMVSFYSEWDFVSSF